MPSLPPNKTYGIRYILEGPMTRHGEPHYMVLMPDKKVNVTFKSGKTKVYACWPCALKHLRAQIVGQPMKVEIVIAAKRPTPKPPSPRWP